VASESCEWEIGRAEAFRKRVIPVVSRAVSSADVPERLQRLNYIYFCGDNYSFARSLADLSSSLSVDIDWIREHTRLASLAERWKSTGRLPAQLLRGDEVPAAMKWLGSAPGNGAEPTTLQHDFIKASENDERNRIAADLAREAAIQDAEAKHQRAELQAQRMRKYLVAAALIFVVILVLFGLLYWQKQVEAELVTAEVARLRAEADLEKAFTRLDASVTESPHTEGDLSSDPAGESVNAQVALISPNALNAIVLLEVGGRGRYDAVFSKPVWPGGQSGINIGIGYDLGFASKEELVADWERVVDQKTLGVLLSMQGITGSQARAIAKSLDGVRIPWDAAIEVFRFKTLPKYVKLLRGAVPGVTDLPPDSFGALLSLVYNRGAHCFKSGGDRCTEMQQIRELISNKNYKDVPEQIRRMKRLYPQIKGLQDRREREAKLFEEGLASSKYSSP